MRDYVSPEELNAYAVLCNSVAEADAARGAKAVGESNLPPAPPRLTLGLNDLLAAEAARAENEANLCAGDERFPNFGTGCS